MPLFKLVDVIYVLSMLIMTTCVIVGRGHLNCKHNKFAKLIYIHVLISYLFELMGVLFSYTYGESTASFNTYILLDIPLLAYASMQASQTVRKKRHLLLCIILLYTAIWVANVLYSGISTFTNWAFVSGSVVLFILYLTVVTDTLSHIRVFPFKHPLIVISFGIVVYYASNIPIFSFLGYLNAHYSTLAENMFIINLILSCIHYILIAAFFLLLRKQQSHVR